MPNPRSWIPPFLTAIFLVVCPAHAAVTTHSGTCTEPDGRSFRVTYSNDSQSGLVQVTNLEVRSSASFPFVPFTDGPTTVSKLEYWTPTTFNSLFVDPAGGYSFAFVTLAVDPAGYATWWGARDGRNAILTQPVYLNLNPRVEFRTDNAPLRRDADTCDVFLAPYSAGSGTNPRRVVHIGDSISDQMAPRLSQLNFLAGRRYLIDPQSGQSYRSMIAEARGIAVGIRDVNGTHVRPDVLVVALGTNDVGGALFASDFEAWKTGLGWIVARLLIDTANIPCRVVMTVRDAGRDPGFENPRLAAAADAYNQLITGVVRANPAAFRLVDWNQLAAGHRPRSPDEWFSISPFSQQYDTVHPNQKGLDALSHALFQAEQSCLAQ